MDQELWERAEGEDEGDKARLYHSWGHTYEPYEQDSLQLPADLRILCIAPLPEQVSQLLEAARPGVSTLLLTQQQLRQTHLLAEATQPDMALIGLSEQDCCGEGLELLVALRRRWRRLPAIIFCQEPISADWRRLVLAGAHGYLAWDTPPALVIAAINLVHQGCYVCGPQLTTG
jgi:DNA-binding NarL/FixJ family response regulator